MSTTILAAPTTNTGSATFLLYAAMAAGFYFLVIRPRRTQMQRAKAVQSSIGVGTEVITTAGVYGRIVAENEDDTVLLEIAPGVPIRIARAAIARPINPVVAEDTAAVDTDEPPVTD